MGHSATGVVVGAGDRGYDAYARLFLDEPDAGRIVGVAEPDEGRRSRFARRYDLPARRCHTSWEDLFSKPQMADFALIATGDAHHVEPTLAALAAGYHVLLEKPMALDEADCHRLVRAADEADRVLAVCHVYRYSHLFSRLADVISSGDLGDVVAIQQSENVAFWHYAHSYARGHTRRSTVPWLLQKSCHDLDLISWLAGSPAVQISSFIRPTELRPEKAPDGAPEFCIQGCPHSETCPYDAVAIYRDLGPVLGDLAMTDRPIGLGPAARALRAALPRLNRLPGLDRRLGWWRWPVAAVTDDHTPEGLDHALRTTRWGRCAYRVGDNDQPSAQLVSMRFANDVVAGFMLHSTSHRTMRQVRVDGTRGSAMGELHALDGWLRVTDHATGRTRRIEVPTAYDGHGGGERPLFRDFLAAIRDGRSPMVSASESLESHRLAFGAMRSAREGRVVDLTA